MGRIGDDTLQSAAATCSDALLTLAWGYDDAGYKDKAKDILGLRKSLLLVVQKRQMMHYHEET